MDQLSVESDTKRGPNKITTKKVINKIRKDYRAFIRKILTINGIILVLIIILIILIKFLILDKKKKGNCSEGFFHPDDENSSSSCYPCNLGNCNICTGDKNNNICNSCKNNFVPKFDKDNIIKSCNEKCQIGDNEKCKECDLDKNECLNCNEGFYLPSDDEIKLECKRCSLKHCQICHGTLNKSICDSCENNYKEELLNGIITLCKNRQFQKNKCEIGDGKKCLSCSLTEDNKCGSCNPSYILLDGKCQPEHATSENINGSER